MSSDSYGQPAADPPNFGKAPSPEPSGPAGLGDRPDHPSWGDPNYGQPNYGQPGSGQPGHQPGHGQPGYGQAGFDQPGFDQAGFDQPGYGQAGYEQPNYGSPAYGQPYPGQPYPAQPYGYQPPPYGSPPPGPMAPAYSPYYPQPSSSNGLALGALITGILGFLCVLPGLVGIGLGIAGLNEAKRTGAGRGMSITGICFGIGWALLWVGLIVIGTATSN